MELVWFVAILLFGLVSAAILWPLMGRNTAPAPRAAHDVEVYGAQLRELEGDAARGAIGQGEAASAKAEIGRRLLKAAAEAEREAGSGGAPSPYWTKAFGLAAFAILAAVSFGLYATTGAPNRPDMPLSARLRVDPRDADMPTLVAKAEARLKEEPNDGRGWETLLPIYLQTGRPADAVRAADNVIRLLGSTSDREAMRGEALMQVASGQVTDGARGAFEKSLRLDPQNAAARFFLALGLSQRGDFAGAAPAWQEIIDRGPADAPWIRTARAALDEAHRELAGTKAPGPTAADVASAADLSDGDRDAMVEGMVAQLAERLKSAPNDADGWKRLMRSYAVLGREAEARGAYMQARSIFADGTAERGSIDEFARGLGLGDGKATP